MFHELFRTKERRVVGVILGIVFIILLGVVISGVSGGSKPLEKAVIAENYLNAKSYEEAVKAYQEALSVKGSDEEFLSIGLAEAYVGLENYDKALEVLRSCYQKTATGKLKDKIEEVTAAKTDYEFLQSISRGDVYYANREYNKAIDVYEEAKLIKRKDILPYQKITQAYIKQEQYELAEKEVTEGIEVTGNEELYKLLSTVDHYLQKGQYDDIITTAEEYIYQENYEDGIDAYREAIKLIPEEAKAYLSLAQFYIDQEDYDSAVALLKEGTSLNEDTTLKELLNSATIKQQRSEERIGMLSELRDALIKRDITTVLAILGSDFYQSDIVPDAPVYFGISDDESNGNGLVIYSTDRLYYGKLQNSMKKGSGIYLAATSNEYGEGYYYYEGAWDNDIPSGKGKTVDTELKKNTSGDIYEYMTMTEGTFDQALEDGLMKKIFYKDGTEVNWMKYRASNGIPLAMDSTKKQPSPTPATEPYVIGALFHGESKTGESYIAEPGTVWGVEPFLRQ